jgi:hypothetical protein
MDIFINKKPIKVSNLKETERAIDFDDFDNN